MTCFLTLWRVPLPAARNTAAVPAKLFIWRKKRQSLP
jgi:hypothetical protein